MAEKKNIWDKPVPKGVKHTKLTPAYKASAKAAAQKRGDSQPGMVDYINAAKRQNAAEKSRKSTAKKTATTPPAAKKPAAKTSAAKKACR